LGAFENGKLGEFICATRLMKLGECVEIINLNTTDILVDHPQGLIRVQVKASSFKSNNRNNGYQFSICKGSKTKRPLDKTDCDVIAFVALDCERVIFKPVECLKGQVTKRFLPRKFERDDLEQKSWRQCLLHLFDHDCSNSSTEMTSFAKSSRISSSLM